MSEDMTASICEARMMWANLTFDELGQSLIKGDLVFLNDHFSDLLGLLCFVRAQAECM